jgi:phosphoribosylanthranilate isomerase
MPTPPPLRTRVKICGLTRAQDISAAVGAGVDALGFVFVPASLRHVSLEQAAALFAEVPAFVQTVALFLDPAPSEVEAVIQGLSPDLLQFHGQESGRFCRQFSRPYIKALGIDLFTGDAVNRLPAVLADHPTARGFLLDSHASGALGGTGGTFDWSHWPKGQSHRNNFILAGGLTADNAQQAISTLHPYALDVSSGVEDAPGIKSARKIFEFMTQVNLN